MNARTHSYCVFPTLSFIYFFMGNQDVQINLLSELASLCWKVFVGDGQPLVAKQPLDEFD